MIRKIALATAAAVAAALGFGVAGAVAAPKPGTPLSMMAVHDHLPVPSSLAQAIKLRLGLSPRLAAADASPATAQQQELQPSEPATFLFGWTVSLTADGHRALVGAPGSTVGAAYVFVERGGTWSERQVLESPVGSAQDSYGYSVALAGDGATALVGAWTGDGGDGVAYSYEFRGGRYVLDGQITAPDAATGDAFGSSVSLSAVGNVALIGAPDRAGFEGGAYVFVHTPRGWRELREYQDPVAAGEAYGYSVAEAPDGLSGVVGAPFAAAGHGAAYAFSQFESSQQRLVGPAAARPFLFGASVSVDAPGHRVLVGSPSANLGDGAAFVFDRTAGGWTQPQELVQPDPGGSDAFGYSVALDYPGDVALIGAIGKNGTAGAAYTFAGYPTLTGQRELTEPPPPTGEQYGFSVAENAIGSELLIGAPYSNDAAGAAWAAENPLG